MIMSKYDLLIMWAFIGPLVGHAYGMLQGEVKGLRARDEDEDDDDDFDTDY